MTSCTLHFSNAIVVCCNTIDWPKEARGMQSGLPFFACQKPTILSLLYKRKQCLQ
ncbi:hypothetical protein IscW_ISCW007481 [Ixodes scapularis]|uniref:Uncharacterized protein n=1 Tax=Ixodes scapularis TaxID=6945 RepID=B7PSE3_IXOSC|nr:hypothetical protein IscW_ISCW007481 [Ixodes scapularis]|eukprot:XP_002402325.1 hypothetical protein IscW_ISCW007481 [Ixodes scapularis]